MSKDTAPEWEDMLGSQSLFVRNLVSGQGPRPLDGQEVTIHLQGRMLKSVHVDVDMEQTPFYDEENVNVVIGERDIVTGLEMAIRFLQEGSKSEVKFVSRFGYNHIGSEEYNIPPDTPLHYKIELLKLGSPPLPVNQLSAEVKIAKALKFKILGNKVYKQQELDAAVVWYSKALSFFKDMSYDQCASKEMKEQFYQLQVDIGNNLSACFISLKDDEKAKEACIAVLEIDGANMKALLRAAALSLRRHDYEEVKACLNRAKEVDPENKKVSQLEKQFQASIMQDKKKERERWGGFLGKESKKSATVNVQKVVKEEIVEQPMKKIRNVVITEKDDDDSDDDDNNNTPVSEEVIDDNKDIVVPKIETKSKEEVVMEDKQVKENDSWLSKEIKQSLIILIVAIITFIIMKWME